MPCPSMPVVPKGKAMKTVERLVVTLTHAEVAELIELDSKYWRFYMSHDTAEGLHLTFEAVPHPEPAPQDPDYAPF